MSNALAEAAKTIDEISVRAMEAFHSPESFEKELQVAQAVEDMRVALTDEVMKPVMALMNTSIGFDTDRNPNKTPLDKDGKPMTPYAMTVVRDVFIESRLRGFHTVGNEFNIIAGKFYACLNGFERKVRKNPKVTDFKDWFEVPRIGNGGALIKCKAEWRQEGKPQVLEREFAVRVNTGMGADAIVGKAKRKLYAAVFGRLTGVVTPDGDAGDVVEVSATKTETATSDVFKTKAEARPASMETTTGTQAPAGQATVPENSQEPIADSQKKKDAKELSPALDALRIINDCKVPFDDFRDFMRTKNLATAKEIDGWTSYGDVAERRFEWFKSNPKTLAELLKKFGSVQSK